MVVMATVVAAVLVPARGERGATLAATAATVAATAAVA